MSSINEALRRSNRAESASGEYLSLSPLPEETRKRSALRWVWLLIPLVVLAALGGFWFRKGRLPGMDAPKSSDYPPAKKTAEVKPPEKKIAPPDTPPPIEKSVPASEAMPAPEVVADKPDLPDTTPTPPVVVEKTVPLSVATKDKAMESTSVSGLGEGLIDMPGQKENELGSALPVGGKPPVKESLVDAAKTLPPSQDSAVDHLGAGPAASLGEKAQKEQTVGEKPEPQTSPTNSNILMAADYFQIASVSAEQGRYSEAVEAYRRAIALHPEMVEARLNLGNVYLFHFDDQKKARAEYEAVIKLDPDSKMAQNNLGVMLLRQNRLKEAEERFRAALKSDPGYVDPLYNLACAAARSGRPEEALGYLDQAHKLEPEVADWASDDEDLKSLRGHPEFAKIVQVR